MNKELWEKCIAFHGHECGGLAIGYRAALLIRKMWNTEGSHDEEIVCVAETDACSVDGIQVLLGCTLGKGNLLFRIRGKQAFSFFNRSTGEAVRLVLKEKPKGMSKEESMNYMLESPDEQIFEIGKPKFELPEKARIFRSYKCDCCGEMTAEHLIRLQGDKKLCLDCFIPYERFQ